MGREKNRVYKSFIERLSEYNDILIISLTASSIRSCIFKFPSKPHSIVTGCQVYCIYSVQKSTINLAANSIITPVHYTIAAIPIIHYGARWSLRGRKIMRNLYNFLFCWLNLTLPRPSLSSYKTILVPK